MLSGATGIHVLCTVAGRDCGRCSLSWVAYPIDSYPFEVKGELYVRVTGGLSVFLPPPWFWRSPNDALVALEAVYPVYLLT